MSNDQAYDRYKLDNFHSKALEKNPLNSTADRTINIYLPPDYFKSDHKRYPVIYFLHGYGGHNRSWTITSKDSKDSGVPWELIPKKILKRIDLDRLITFESLDKLILNGDLEPFILVQPDASLQTPHKRGTKDFRGLPLLKGSFYINSPYTGNYIEYIIQDIINYIDKNYRTIADKQYRALMGGSMGGYGALYLCLHHPEKFISAVSLSPGNIANLEFVNWKLRVPIYKEIFGIKMCEQLGDLSMEDILDSFDLITSKDNPLLPSINCDESGHIIGYNQEALKNWQMYDLNNIIRKNPDALKQVHILLNCERTDEFGLADGTMKIHETLLEFGINHQFELYSDPTVVLTPHILGIGYKILPGIRFCLEYFK